MHRRRHTDRGGRSPWGHCWTALVTKIRCPQTTGLECASPGIGVRQRMFSPVLPFHRSGRFCRSATPEACGPRKEGQLPFEVFGSGRAGGRAAARGPNDAPRGRGFYLSSGRPGAAVQNHLSWPALIRDEVEADVVTVLAKPISPGSFTTLGAAGR